MPVIVNPQYDNPDIGKGLSDLGYALFGNAEDRANRDLRVAQTRNYMAEGGLNEAKRQRQLLANEAATKYPELAASLTRKVKPDGTMETDPEYDARTGSIIGSLWQGDTTGNIDNLAQATGRFRSQGYAQGNDAASLRRSLIVQGVAPSANAAVNPAEVKQFQDAEYARLLDQQREQTRSAMGVAGVQAATQRRNQDLEHGDRRYRTDKEFPGGKPLLAGKDQTIYPALPGGGYDYQHPIGGGGKRGNVQDKLTDAQRNDMINGFLEGYPGLTTRKKGRLEYDKNFGTSDNFTAAQYEAARKAGEDAILASGRVEDGIAAMRKSAGMPAGTKYSVQSSNFGLPFVSSDYGHFERPANGATSPIDYSAPAPAAAVSAPAPAPVRGVAPAPRPVTVAAVVPPRPVDPATVAARAAQDDYWARARAQTKQLAQQPAPAPVQRPATVAAVVPQAVDPYAAAARAEQDDYWTRARAQTQQLAQQQPAPPPSPVVQAVTQHLPVPSGINAEARTAAAARGGDAAMRAEAADYDARQQAAQMGPQDETPRGPTADIFSDYNTASQVANDPNPEVGGDMKRAAREYLATHQPQAKIDFRSRGPGAKAKEVSEVIGKSALAAKQDGDVAHTNAGIFQKQRGKWVLVPSRLPFQKEQGKIAYAPGQR